jgi:hypothetical protein
MLKDEGHTVEGNVISKDCESVAITIPAAEINKLFAAKYDKLRRHTKLKGYRPGRIPLNILRSKFAKKIAEDLQHSILSNHIYSKVSGNRSIYHKVELIEHSPCKEQEDFSFVLNFYGFDFSIDNDDFEDLDLGYDPLPNLMSRVEFEAHFRDNLRNEVILPADATVDKESLVQMVTIQLDSESIENKTLLCPYQSETTIGNMGDGQCDHKGVLALLHGLKVGESTTCENIPWLWYDSTPIVFKTVKVTVRKLKALLPIELTTDVASVFGHTSIECLIDAKFGEYQYEVLSEPLTKAYDDISEALRELYPVNLPENILTDLAQQAKLDVCFQHPDLNANEAPYVIEEQFDALRSSWKDCLRVFAIANRKKVTVSMAKVVEFENVQRPIVEESGRSLLGPCQTFLGAYHKALLNEVCTQLRVSVVKDKIKHLLTLPNEEATT